MAYTPRFRRPLEQMTVGLSISESSDTREYGYSQDAINRVVIRLSERLLGHGAVVVFGHDWRSDGVMAAVSRLALRYCNITDEKITMINLLPWPDRPSISQDTLKELSPTLDVRQPGLPDELKHFTDKYDELESTEQLWLRARALTHMRRSIAETVDAQVCFGGRTSTSSGRFPGIVEEAFLVSKADKPVFLSGVLGGAAKKIITAISSPSDWSDELVQTRDDVKQAFDKHQDTANSTADALLDPSPIREHFTRTMSISDMQARCSLTQADLSTLWRTSTTEEAMTLTIRGLRKLWNSTDAQ